MWTRLRWGSYGVLATLVGLGTAHLAASLTNPASSPVLAVGSTVIDLTPTPMKDWAIRTFGSADLQSPTPPAAAGFGHRCW